MATFRVEKTNDFTIMSNHHLRNNVLSLKAKGLLSQMLSLPEDWDYTLAGLSRINREKIDAIREAVRELERAGYIVRSRERDEKGRLRGTEYVIYERPQTPTLENPTLENPTLENPTLENPTLENPTQLNTKESSTKEPSTKVLNTKESSTENIPFRRFPTTDAPADPAGKGTEAALQPETDSVTRAAEQIKANIDYDQLVVARSDDRELLDEIVEIVAETVSTSRKTVRIASDDYPAELVRKKFRRLGRKHISFVLDNLRRNTTDIRDVRQYIRASLFNAPSTIGLASATPSGNGDSKSFDSDEFFNAALNAGMKTLMESSPGMNNSS